MAPRARQNLLRPISRGTATTKTVRLESSKHRIVVTGVNPNRQDSIHDDADRQVQVIDAAGNLARITDLDGYGATLAYDANNHVRPHRWPAEVGPLNSAECIDVRIRLFRI